ncbi:MAG: AMP-binding protein [Alphaproteobacteria bacterium]|nr:AMP-binding protein [Alphaproteobacteria bacterium]
MTLESSHVKGPTTPPLYEETIGQALKQAAKQWPEREALVSVHQNIRWTFEELDRRATDLACGLLSLGLERGDRVGIWAPNCAEWALTQFATAKAGMILVNINPAYRVGELEYTLNKVGVKALVVAERFKTSDYPAMLAELAPEIAKSKPGALIAEKLPHLKTLILIADVPRAGYLRFRDVLGMGQPKHHVALAAVERKLESHDPINIQFTSGTTGLPKGAMLSHRNIFNNGFFVGRSIALEEGDRLCIPVPLYHCFGMVMGNLACIAHGATMVYPSEGFDPLAVLQAIEQEKCTALYGVPTMFIAILDHPEFEQFNLRSLRTGIMAGAPCPIEVMRRVIDKMHMGAVTIAYGMTETSPVSFQSSPGDPIERRVSTVGTVQPHLEVKIVDAEGKTTPVGESGELCTRGYSVMIGYWDDAEKTKEAVDKDGWMHTGDLATIDAEGYGNIVGRIKDMVIRGGENIYPREVEEYLFRHPKVAEVSVVGVPDDKYGEELCAWIKLKPGERAHEDEIKAYARNNIAHYKVPRYVRFVESFPMTVTGKIQKFLIRQAMIEDLGLSEQQTA